MNYEVLHHASIKFTSDKVIYFDPYNIDDELHLISPAILEPIVNLKTKTLGSRNPELSCEEILTALSICAVTNPTAQVVLDKLPLLKGSQAHSTTILSKNDEQTFRELGIDVTLYETIVTPSFSTFTTYSPTL